MKKFFSLVLATVVATATAFAAVQTVTNDNVTCGTNVTITAEPATGHHFVQWSDGNKSATRTLENVTGDIELTAIFAIDTFTITFMAHGQVYATQRVTYGSTPAVPSGTPESYQTNENIYTFSNWPALAAATGDATYTAVYTAATRYYTITFKNYNGEVLETQSLPWNAVVTYGGPTPTKPSDSEHNYTFSGWDQTIVNVAGDATYIAQFEDTERQYTITVVVQGEGGTAEVVGSATVNYNGKVTIKATAANCYEFDKWLEDSNNTAERQVTVTGDATYTATFKVLHHSVTINSNDGAQGTVRFVTQ